jgi:hypothetical protein
MTGRSAAAISTVVLALIASGCGHRASIDSASARPARTHTLSGAGLTLQLPPDWTGRIVEPKPSANEPNVLQAGSAQLLRFDGSGGDNIIDTLGRGATFVNVLDYGAPATWMATDPRWAHTLPVQIGAADLEGAGAAVDPKRKAIVMLIANGHALVVTVAFGESDPTSDEIAAANAVISSLSIKPDA